MIGNISKYFYKFIHFIWPSIGCTIQIIQTCEQFCCSLYMCWNAQLVHICRHHVIQKSQEMSWHKVSSCHCPERDDCAFGWPILRPTERCQCSVTEWPTRAYARTCHPAWFGGERPTRVTVLSAVWGFHVWSESRTCEPSCEGEAADRRRVGLEHRHEGGPDLYRACIWDHAPGVAIYALLLETPAPRHCMWPLVSCFSPPHQCTQLLCA